LASLEHPANLNGFCVLAALLHGTLVVGVRPKFVVLNRGCHLYSAGQPSRWAFAHILVNAIINLRSLFTGSDVPIWSSWCSLFTQYTKWIN